MVWYRSSEDPDKWLLVETWRDANAGNQHVNSEHFQKVMTPLPGWLAAVPQIINVEVPGHEWSAMSEMQIEPPARS